jgi:Leucine-rich repeat (LRR) protein
MKKYIYILLLAIIFNCSKKEDEVIPEIVLENFELTSKETTVQQLQFVIIESSEMIFSDDSYKATFGDLEIDLYKTENNSLIFSIPDTSVGTNKLELIIENKIGNISFNVKENIDQNIDNIIENEITSPLNSYQNEIQELLSDNTIPLEIKEQLTSAKKGVDEYISKLATLSNEEKINVAKFFNANPILTTDYLNLSSKSFGSKTNTKYSSIKRSALKLVIIIATVVTTAEIIAPLIAKGLASLGTFVGVSTVGAGIIVTALGAAAIIHAEHNKILNSAFLPFENVLKDDNGNYLDKNSGKNSGKNKTVSNGYEVNNNENYVFNILSKDRLLNSSDINNSNSDISELVKKIKTLESKWETFKNGVNTIVSDTTNWFTSWFSSSSTSFKLITYELKSLPSTTDSIETEGQSQYITIVDFPSDVEVEYSEAPDNSINLKFKADESTLPRTVTGKIKYDDGDFSNEKEFTVTLENEGLVLEGDLSFGEVIVNTTSTKTLKLTNSYQSPLIVSSIDLPEGFTIDWEKGSIEPEATKEVAITFAPTEIKEYAGQIVVNNDLDQTNNSKAIGGNGIEDDGMLILEGDLSFENVFVNASSTKTLKLTNSYQSPLIVSSIGLPEGFTINWENGSIEPDTTKEVFVTFTPTEIKEYAGQIVVNNDLDQTNNTMTLSGNGIDDNGNLFSDAAAVKAILSANGLNVSDPRWDSTIESEVVGILSENGCEASGVPTRVIILDFHNKNLTTLPAEIGNLTNLSKLYLHNNSLTSIPTIIGSLTNLTRLDLGVNNLSSIPETIGNLINLWELNLDSNNLTSIPETIGNLSKTEELDLGYNDLTSIPAVIGNLTNLTYLKLASNNLTNIPATIGNLTSLSFFTLGSNNLTSVPETIGNLTNLTHLSLNNNSLSSIPTTIGNLTKLPSLKLAYNNLSSIPETIGNLINLTEINLSDNNLTSIPETIGNLTELHTLFLGSNNLTSIPETIGNLTNLTSLTLYNNKLTSIPTTIGNLTKLPSLELADNNLSSIPETIGKLINLEKIILRNNNLTSIPETIGNLSKTEELDLGYNDLTSIPAVIGNLTSLKTLRLVSNGMKCLPSAVWNLKNNYGTTIYTDLEEGDTDCSN